MSLGNKIRNLTSEVRFQSKECYLLAELAAKIADSKIDDYVGEIQTTNHGMKCEVDREALDHKIKETQESLDGLIAAKKLCR